MRVRHLGKDKILYNSIMLNKAILAQTAVDLRFY